MIMTSLPLAAFAEDTYVIQEGDVLWKIAEKYGRTYEELAEYNNIEDPNKIYAGDELKIPDDAKKITILGTSDLHGRIYAYDYATDTVDKDAGLAKIQSIVKRERAIDPDALLIDMGDTVQDNSAELFNDLAVHPMVQAMNEMNYDIWTLGNHEFNFEKSFLDKNIAAFEGTVLSANIYQEGTNNRYVDGYKIFTIDGVRVAVVGMLPPNVPLWEAATPSHFTGLEFTTILTETAKLVTELEGKYDVLVGAFHFGEDQRDNYPGMSELAEAFPQFDVMFGAHDHSKVTAEVNGVKLIEPGKYGWALAKAEISLKSTAAGYEVTAVATENIETYNEVEDQGILDKFAFVHDTSVANANEVIGTVTADYVERVDFITGEAEVTTMPTAQVQDTALIDLINEVQMFYTGADISSAAAFKTDMNLVAGDFKRKNLADIYKYTNTLNGVNISGANLKEYMEWSASYFNTYTEGDVTVSFNENVRGYNFDMFAGVTYDIDISKEAGERITNLLLDGVAIDDAGIYKLAVNNYRLGTLLKNGWVTADDEYYNSDPEGLGDGRIRDLIGVYLMGELAGIATPSVDNNWKIIGADLMPTGYEKVLELIISKDILIPTSEDGRTPNVKAINVHDPNVYELIKDSTAKELTIMHTNDMHGFFKYGKYDGMGAALLATKIKEVRAAETNSLLLDGGDALQGANLVTLTKGVEGTKVMNALGYDAMAAGNHEFDYGQEKLLELDDLLDYPILAANITKEDGSTLLTPYIIKEMDGFKVGIFGLSTPETTWKSHPKNSVGLTFADPIETAEAMVTELADKADIIIAVAHIGNEGEFTTEKIAEAVDGIDVMIDGHSHSEYANGLHVGDTLIVQAEEKTKNLGMAKLSIVDGEVVNSTAFMYTKSDAADTTPDAAVEAIIEAIDLVNAPVENEVVATSPLELTGEREVVRAGEAALGNLIAESMLYVSGADVALTNGGGIRATLPAGEVTKGNVLEVLPFGNTVQVIEVTGADILAAVEHGIQDYPTTKGAFPHVAGMTVKFDATKEPLARVTELMIAGELVNLTKTYTLVTSDYLASPGDGYTMFGGKDVVAEYNTQDVELIAYINEVGFDKAKIDGRMQEISNLISFIISIFAA